MNNNTNIPVFLVGAERSGTTLLTLMLDNHPGVTWLGEFEFVVDCIDDEGNWPPLDQYYEWLQRDRIFLETKFHVDKSLDYPSLMKSFFTQSVPQDKNIVVGATCHRHFDRLLRIWPEIKFIHILRDPRDVARSNISMGWAGNVWYGIDRWVEAENIWSHLETKVDPSRRFEFKYEDLVCEPERLLSDICTFIGVDYHPDMLTYDKTSTYSAPDKRLIYQWKKKLTTSQVQLIESKVAELVEKNGYELSGANKISPGWLQRKTLWLDHKLRKTQFRIKRFGLFLLLCNFIARKLYISSFEDWSLRKIHAIQKLNLK